MIGTIFTVIDNKLEVHYGVFTPYSNWEYFFFYPDLRSSLKHEVITYLEELGSMSSYDSLRTNIAIVYAENIECDLDDESPKHSIHSKKHKDNLIQLLKSFGKVGVS